MKGWRLTLFVDNPDQEQVRLLKTFLDFHYQQQYILRSGQLPHIYLYLPTLITVPSVKLSW